MLVPQGTSAIMELSRANSIAEKLGSKSMLLPGVAPSALPPPDADIVEGLRAGDDTAFFEAAGCIRIWSLKEGWQQRFSRHIFAF